MTAAENLAVALHAHRTLHTYTNEGVAYAWVKQHPLGSRYLLVERKPEHFYRIRQSLGVDLDIWHDALDHGINSIIMIYQGAEGKIVYRANISTWRLAGFPVLHYRNFHDQMQLPIRAMEELEKH